MEKVIIKILEWYLEQNKSLNQYQNSFRKKRFTIDNLFHLQ